MFRAFGTMFILLLFLSFRAGTSFADGEKIADIVIKGNRRIETAAIKNVVTVKAGDYLFREKVDADIRAIYKLGQFEDVKAVTSESDKGVILTYEVVEKPIVREIKMEGNKEIGADKIREALEVKTNSVYSPKDLAKSVKKVKKLYADEGYYLAEVDAKTEKRSATDVRITISIKEGDKVLIKTIRFEGNRAFTPGQLRKVMETGEKWFLSWLTGAGTYKEEVLKNDVNLIADLYFNNGYINVRVGEPKVELLPDKSGLQVTIGITEGDQYRTGSLGFKGDLLESEPVLASKLKLKSGEVFSRGSLRTDVFSLTDLYADKGYAFANVTPLSKVNPEQKNIDITFDMEKGEKVYIDRINISGNTKSRDKVIRREIRLAEGDLYNSSGIKASKQNLMNLGYFEEANLSTAKGRGDNKLDLNVEVKEKATGTFSIGGGYSSLDGLIGQGSVQQANFLGLGLKLNAAASIGGKTQTYNLGLTDPYFLDTKWTLGGDIYRSERDYIDFTRRATGADIKAGYPLSPTLSTFWLYKLEDVKISNKSQALKESEAVTGVEVATSSTTSSITASLTQNTADYRLDPSSGMINSLSVEFAGLGGTTRYMSYIGSSTLFLPFKWGTVFSLKGTFGYLQELGKPIPIDQRFYLGGINTIRGYGGRTVSPFNAVEITTTDSNGVASTTTSRAYFGGDTEVFFNGEYTFPLLKEAGLKGVVFFDAGNSYNTIDEIFSRVQMSYGFGVRWFSPIGPLRLEYGIPVNPRPGIDKSGGKLEFAIGSFF